MNLLSDRWIPVYRADRAIYWIAPWELTSAASNNPIVGLAYVRPDLTGSIFQFLIGWLQTIVPVDDEDDWSDLLDEAPTSDQLKSWSEVWLPAFEVFGDGPRFMQDTDVAVTEQGSLVSIEGLLMDSPGGNTLKQNIDHFNKRGSVSHLSKELAAAALYSLQLNAPSGGQGHRTSMRGGGPLTTLIVADPRKAEADLWKSLWLNVLDWESFSRLYECERPDGPSDLIFPWMGDTRTSNPKVKGVVTTPDHAHPLQMYWSMPRRIRLQGPASHNHACDLCGPEGSEVVFGYYTKNFGVNYEGAWTHALSPYYFDKDGVGLPLHAQAGGFNYRHWMGLVVGKEQQRAPARVVQHALITSRQGEENIRLWAFGYDMDNMKAVAWYESLFPLYPTLPGSRREEFDVTVEAMVEAANLSRNYLQTSIKAAWFKRPGDLKGDTSAIDMMFWRQTEQPFYRALDNLHAALKTESPGSKPARDEIKKRWWNVLVRECAIEFDRRTSSGDFRQEDPKKISVARAGLIKSLYGKKLRTTVLDLPILKKPIKEENEA